MNIVFFDLEANGLFHEWEAQAATHIDCLVMYSEDAGEYSEYEEGDHYPNITGTVVGHNIMDYDLPMLTKHWGWEHSILPDTWMGVPVKFVDTMLLSKLLNLDRKLPKGFAEQFRPAYQGQGLPGPHSLDCWAFRLGMKKPKLVYGDNLGNVPYEISVAQATADVDITRALYWHLAEEAKLLGLDLHQAMEVEKNVRYIMTEGATEGVLFDSKLAEKCLIELDAMMLKLASEVEPHLPPRELPKSKLKMPPKNRFKKDGTPSALAVKYFGERLRQYHHWVGEEPPHRFKDGEWFVTYDNGLPTGYWVSLKDATKPLQPTGVMSISDSADVKQWLIEVHGWKPTLYNTKKDENGKKIKTSPKFHENGKLCDNLEMLGETIEIVKKIVLYLSYRNRRSVIKAKDEDKKTGWLNHPRLAIDGKLPADADTMGTNTFRMAHRVVANVPRLSSIYGSEMRSMFAAIVGYKLVGWHASGLEDRVKAHYCYNMPGGAEYIKKILDPEFSVHDENVKAWGLPKAKCKNGHYAMQYNCRPTKLAETLGIPQAEADQYYEAWWANNEPLRFFIQKANATWAHYDKKWLPAIDGRLVPCRLEYMTTSRLFQSAGVIAMKYAMVIWWYQIRRLGLDAKQIIHYHDEAQAMAREDIADKVGEIGCYSILKAGQVLNFNVPLLSEYKIGDTWSDTH